MKRNKKNRYPTYNEARLIKIKEEEDTKRILDDERMVELKQIKLIAKEIAKKNNIDPQIVFNYMVLFRFNKLK